MTDQTIIAKDKDGNELARMQWNLSHQMLIDHAGITKKQFIEEWVKLELDAKNAGVR